MEFYSHSGQSFRWNQPKFRKPMRTKSIGRKRKEILKEINDAENEFPGENIEHETENRKGHRFVEAPETLMPTNVVRQREKKWLHMLQNWERFMSRGRSKVKDRCRKGIPPSLRGRAWQYLSGAVYLQRKNPKLFAELEKMSSPEWDKVIWKDIPRTFPYHQLFADGGTGQAELFRVLSAYSLYDPGIGYSQAMAPVAAVLIMHMTAEDAFWVLVSICKKYMTGYYGPKLEAVQLDGLVFSRLLQQFLPPIARHLENRRVDPLLYIVEWTMCMFCRSLPFSTVLRLWDMFFFEGIKVLFRTSLAILKLVFPSSGDINHLSEDYEIVQRLVNLPLDVTHEDIIVPESLALHLKDKDLEKHHAGVLAERPDLVFE